MFQKNYNKIIQKQLQISLIKKHLKKNMYIYRKKTKNIDEQRLKQYINGKSKSHKSSQRNNSEIVTN